MENVKINSLEIENVKRIKAVKLEPSQSGLTIIGGNNNQGKTSVLDSIAWALGGNHFRPANATREGSVIPPNIHITLSNGLVVERKGKNSDLKVTDPTGGKAGQTLLNSFIEQLALDLPKFMNASDKEKADTLLRIIGVGEELYKLEDEEKRLYNERLVVGRVADQKDKFAKEQEFYEDAPSELVSASELIKKQQEILAKNGENQRKRDKVDLITSQQTIKAGKIAQLESQIATLTTALEEERAAKAELDKDLVIAQTDALSLVDESTEELKRNIEQIEEINRKVRANLDKAKAEDDAKEEKSKYDALSAKIEEVRNAKTKLLENANLPLQGLSVDDGVLMYKGQPWENMSGSEQLIVSTAIVRKLNPQCGFVLMDKLEQMDMDTLKDFGNWLNNEGLQAIATRVSKGDECSIIIEDGYVVEQPSVPEAQAPSTNWKAGEF